MTAYSTEEDVNLFALSPAQSKLNCSTLQSTKNQTLPLNVIPLLMSTNPTSNLTTRIIALSYFWF